MAAYIGHHRADYGVEPICRALPIALLAYYGWKAVEADSKKVLAPAQRHEVLRPEIWRVFEHYFGVYGVRDVWLQLNRGGIVLAPCAVERLMREMGLQGMIGGRMFKVTTHTA